MKKLVLLILIISIETSVYGQTNTFPASGNVGIGTTTPSTPLQISAGAANSTIALIGGSYFNNASDTRPEGINTPRVALSLYGNGTPDYSWDQKWLFKLGVNGGVLTNGSNKNSNQLIISTTADDDNYSTENQVLTLMGNSSVGIGTTNPVGNLQVMNSLAGFDNSNIIYLTNDNTSYGRTNLILTGRLTNANDAWAFGSMARNSIVFNVNAAADGANVGAVGTEYYSIQLEGNSKSLGFLSSQNGSSPNLVLLQNGNIGIGTANPQSLLSVNGTITGKQMTVTQTGWSDFVFDPAYRLPDLSSTSAYIKAYHHLPGIPSAKQIEDKGLNIGDMEKKQMQKIEEITLYLIQAEKSIDELRNQNEQLQNEMENYNQVQVALEKEVKLLKNKSR
jgi:uncharacterized protein YaiE (UPF0345 family)/FtsZ-binding cell division protein ZapB